MSIRKSIQPHPIPKDLAKELGTGGIKVILELIRDAYFDLVHANVIDLTLDENQITEEWYIWLLERWKSQTGMNLKPIYQKGDRTKAKKGKIPPTVDFCFRSSWHQQVYFGIECKLVEANSKSLCDKYIHNGLLRFINCSYSSNCSEGAMLGYIRQTKCSEVAIQLVTRIAILDGSPALHQSNSLHPFEDYYISRHNRTNCISPFTIHHFLLIF